MYGPETVGVIGLSAFPPTLTYHGNELGGHAGVAVGVLKSGLVGDIVFVPAFAHPCKKELGVDTFDKRVEWTQMTADALPEQYRRHIMVSRIEETLSDGSKRVPTYLTLRALAQSREYENRKVVLVAGSDRCRTASRRNIDNILVGWTHREEIIWERGVIVVPRPYSPVHHDGLPSTVTILQWEPRNGNSGATRQILAELTEINVRQVFAALTDFVCPAVALDMIANAHLFR